MPKGINSDGTPKVRPENSGRKKKDAEAKTFRLARDVVEILEQQKNETKYVEEAVRLKHKKDKH